MKNKLGKLIIVLEPCYMNEIFPLFFLAGQHNLIQIMIFGSVFGWVVSWNWIILRYWESAFFYYFFSKSQENSDASFSACKQEIYQSELITFKP